MNDEQKTMTPRRLAQVIRREAWLVGLVVVLAAGVALIATSLQTTMYRAKMTLVVGQAGGDFQPEIGSPTLTQTITTLFESEVVASEVIKRLKLDTTPEKLSKKVQVVVRPNSSVLEVSADADGIAESERVLSAFEEVFRTQIQRLGVRAENPQLGGGSKESIIFATVFNPPHADPEPVSPRRGRTLVTAILLGLVIGFMLAFVRERLDDRIRTRQEAEEAFSAPVIGGLPSGARVLLPGGDDTGSWRSRRRGNSLEESLRMLSLNLELIDQGNGAAIVVTSTQQDEGKSTLVANLGVSLARSGSHVICVEADPEQPSLRNYLGIAPSRRNGSRPSDQPTLDQLLAPVNLHSGTHAGALAGDLRIMRFEDWQDALAAHGRKDRGATLVKMLRASADYVLIDASPLAVGDASRLALLADNVLMVARAGRARHSRAETARAILNRLEVPNVSVVLTEADPEDLG